MPIYYVVKTDEGYVGRQSLTAELSPSMPKGFAYTYTKDEAEQVAKTFSAVNATVVAL